MVVVRRANCFRYDVDIATQIYRIGMIHEVNFFRSACKEDFDPVPNLPSFHAENEGHQSV